MQCAINDSLNINKLVYSVIEIKDKFNPYLLLRKWENIFSSSIFKAIPYQRLSWSSVSTHTTWRVSLISNRNLKVFC